jgi:hypothetical protein
MFKNIILAVLIAIVLTYSLGHLASQWLDLHVTFAEHNFEPITSILAAIAFALIAAGIGLFVAGLSIFWPVILFTLVIFLLVKDKQTPAY